MEVTGSFFSKLRALAVTLEKEAEQLEQALNREDTQYEDESPMRVLHDLHCEVRTLKPAAGILAEICKTAVSSPGALDEKKCFLSTIWNSNST